MPRVCFSCKTKKGLKSLFVEDCDCHMDLPLSRMFDDITHSVCRHCFFESCDLEMDGSNAGEALEDVNHYDHAKAKD